MEARRLGNGDHTSLGEERWCPWRWRGGLEIMWKIKSVRLGDVLGVGVEGAGGVRMMPRFLFDAAGWIDSLRSGTLEGNQAWGRTI